MVGLLCYLSRWTIPTPAYRAPQLTGPGIQPFVAPVAITIESFGILPELALQLSFMRQMAAHPDPGSDVFERQRAWASAIDIIEAVTLPQLGRDQDLPAK